MNISLMRKPLCFTLVLFFFLAMGPCSQPLLGESPSTSLEFVLNGRAQMTVPAEIRQGYAFIPIQHFAQVTGSSLRWPQRDNPTLVKGDKKFSLTIDAPLSQTPRGSQQLPLRPFLKDGSVYVPLRFLCQELGIPIHWDPQNKTVHLTLEEKNQGMTPADVLSKSAAATLALPSYQVNSQINTTLYHPSHTILSSLSMEGQEWIRQNPYASYLTQTTQDNQTGLTTKNQFIVTNKQIYSRIADENWVASSMGIRDILHSRKEIGGLPVTQQPQEPLGSDAQPIYVFGEGTTYQDQPCFVIKAYFSPVLFKENLQSLLPLLAQVDPSADLQQLFSSLAIQQFQTLYISKATLLKVGSESFEEIMLYIPGQEAPYARFHTSSTLSFRPAEFKVPEGLPGLK